jgi:hypothetical protein
VLTNITLDDVELAKNGEALGVEKKRSSKRKKNKSLKRLGLTDGDALTLTYSTTQNELATGDVRIPPSLRLFLLAWRGMMNVFAVLHRQFMVQEEKLRSALLSVVRRSRGDGGAASSFTHDISTWELPIKVSGHELVNVWRFAHLGSVATGYHASSPATGQWLLWFSV